MKRGAKHSKLANMQRSMECKHSSHTPICKRRKRDGCGAYAASHTTGNFLCKWRPETWGL